MTDEQNQRNPKMFLSCAICRPKRLMAVMPANVPAGRQAETPCLGDKHQRPALLQEEHTWKCAWFPSSLQTKNAARLSSSVLCFNLKHKGKNRLSLCVFPSLWHSPQSRSCRNSAGLLELCVLYRVEHSRPRAQNRLSMQNTALWGTCKPAARETFQFSSSVYSRCVPSILGSQLPLFILFGISIILAKSSDHWGTS